MGEKKGEKGEEQIDYFGYVCELQEEGTHRK